MSDKTDANDSKGVNEPSRSNTKSRSVSKKSTDRTVSDQIKLKDSLHKYQFYSLHEELTFLRNERVNFQHRSQLQYAEIKRLKQQLKAKVHELWDCKERLKAYEIEEQIKESNSANNGKNSRTGEKSKSNVKGQNGMVNYCVTKSEKTPSREIDKEKSEHDVNSQPHDVLEEQEVEKEELKDDEVTSKNSITNSYRSTLHTDNKIINELRRNLAQRDSALHDLQLRSIELDTARGKLAREVERLQQELMNVSEERNTLNNKLLDKDREIDKINKELCASKEHVIEQTREVERLLIRNKTYELLLHDKDDLCFAVGNTFNENELEETNESKQENELCYRNECKVFNDTPTALHAKRLPSQYTSSSDGSGSHKDTSTEESRIIHSVLHSQSLMFKQRIREIQTELINVKESEQRLQHEMQSKQNELDKCNKELMQLREECQRIRDECVFHKEEVVLLQNKIDTMNTEDDNNNDSNDENCKNNKTTKESYVALMRLNRRLQRILDKLQSVQQHDGQTHITNIKSKEDDVCTNNQVNEWKNKCSALQRTNDELQGDNRILARAAELLCASHTQKVNTLSIPPSSSTVSLQHKLQAAQQAIADLQEKLNVVTRENVEYEMLITKIAETVPVHALLCKETETISNSK